MNKAALYLFLLLVFPIDQIFAQHPQRCHSEERTELIKDLDPEYYKSLQNPIPHHTGTQNTSGFLLPEVVTIPVHVIIVHPPGQAVGTGVNFPMDHILSQIDVLNEDFRRMNTDASNTPDVFDAADSEIEFCMASIDPDGNDTDGVTRYGTNQNLNSNENAIKSATGWNRNNYLNIWVGPGLGGLLGWAYLPTLTNLPNATLDGIVVASGTFGGPGYGTTNNYDLGRTSTHEIGHYLGLRHVWGNGGCGNDDGFPDTPIQSGSNFGCPNHPDPSCGNNGDMFMNYMDYVNDDCMNAFTEDQNAHMHAILNSSRSSLLTAANTYCSSVTAPLFVELISQTDALCFGEASGTVTVNASGGAGGYTYAIDGGAFQTSNVFTNLLAGPHVVSAMDNDGSVIDIDVIIGEAPELIPSIDSQVDVTCFGLNDGTIIVSAFGGTPGYQYSIDAGPFSPANVFSNLNAGPHIITVQDLNGCEVETTGFIQEPIELITLPEEIANVTCNGYGDGLISVVTAGGNPNYIYSIDQINFQPEPIFFNLQPGDYQMTTFDDNGCIEETLFSITEPDILELNITEQNDVTCFGDNNGSIILEANGGTNGYEYSIDDINYQSNPIFDGLTPGTYSISVLDANQCYTGVQATIAAPEELVLNLVDQTEAGCAGQAEGSLTFTSIGGSGENIFIYQTDTLTGDTVTFINLPAGSHTVAVYDLNDCNSELVVDIAESAEIAIDTVSYANITCFEANDGMIEVLGNGGSGTYEYSLNNGAYSTENIFMDLAPGDYTVNVLDDAGCGGTVLFNLTAPDEITTNLGNVSNPNCFGDEDGTFSVIASGGAGSFEYTLGTTTNTTGNFSGLAAGTYEVIATDINGCTEMQSVEIENPEAVSLDETSNEPSNCFGEDNASVSLNASGGNDSFEYLLNGEVNSNGVFTNLPPGTYTATATDGNGCSQSIDVVLTEPELLEINIDYVLDVNCAGDASGAIQVETVGGTGNMTFTLDTESNTTGLFEGLVEGDYSIDVLDENGCSSNVSAAVASSEDLEIAEQDQAPVSCFGETDGFIQLTVSGGNGNFEYTLDTETNTSGLFENLSPGSYSAVVTDGSNCSGTYDFEITEPQELESSLDEVANVTCFDDANGMIQLSANGGSGNYTFDNGISTNTSGLFENLNAGNYDVVVTDENGCSTIISSTIDQPTEIEAVISNVENVGCNGQGNGSFVVSAIGGSGNIEYTANGVTNTTGVFENLSAGTYPIIVVDENDCEMTLDAEILESSTIEVEITEAVMNNCFGATEGSIQTEGSGGDGDLEYTLGSETNNSGYFENLPAGDYEVLVTDESGCTNIISQSISEPTELEVNTASIQDIDCFGNSSGAVQFNANGGTGAFEYTLGTQTNSSGLFENLPAGLYEVMVTDENECSVLQNIAIAQPIALETEIIDLQNIECNGSGTGSVAVQASGGNNNYEYTLGTETNSTGIFNDLPAGNYEIQIVDANGCETLEVFDIVEAANLDVEIATIQTIDCFGGATGVIQVSAEGGSGTFEFELDGTTNTTGLFENLEGGVLEVSVTDQNGCTDVLQYEITEPVAIESVVLASETPLCFGEETGSVAITGTGGSGAFEYTMNGETNTTGIFDNLPAGDYDLLLIDGSGCSAQSSISVEAPELLIGSVLENNPANCFEDNNGSVQLNALGGTGTYAYILGTESNISGAFSNLEAGDYEVEVVDAIGCSDIISFSIDQPTEIISEIVEIINIDCGILDGVGFVDVQATGGTGSLEYTLNGTTNTTGLFGNLPAGVYEVQIADENGCSGVQAFSISAGANLNVEIDLVEEVTCFDANNGSIQVSADGGSGDYQFELDGVMNTNGLFENLEGGMYEVTVIDTDGCESTTQYFVEQPTPVLIDNVDLLNVSCFGETDGALEVIAYGGNEEYTYSLGTQTNTDGVFVGLEAATYLLVITDGNGCTTSSNIIVDQPLNLEAEVIENNAVSCYGEEDGMLQVVGSGGSGDFSYTLGLETNTTGTFENLPGGVYDLLVSDANGCSNNIEVTLSQPNEIETEVLDLQSIGCSGNLFGSVQVLAVGGTGAMEYTLGVETNTTGVFENLNAGDYTIEASDINNCTSFIPFSIIQSGDLEAEVLNNMPASCFGESDGMAQVEAIGNGMYTYTLGTETNASGMFNNLPAGNYSVIVSDGAGCETSIEFSISQPNAMIGEAIELSPLTCFGENDAVIQIEAFGGNGPYVFTLNNETNTSGGFENLSAGAYEALITDQNNCTTTVDVFIVEPDAIQTETVQYVEPICYGEEDGLIQLESVGGTAPYEYVLGTETNTTGLFENLSAGSYQVFITDDNGCTITETISLEQPEILLSGAIDVTPVECFGGNDGVLYMGATGGTTPYQFELDGQVNNGGVFFDLSAGLYEVIVTDANGCTKESTALVLEPEELILSATDLEEDTGSGNGSATLVPTGGIGPFLYSLDGINFEAQSVFNDLPAGDYVAYVRDSNGCLSEVSFTIEMGTFISNPDQGVDDIQLFPNPFSNDLFLKVELSEAQEIEIRMFTIHGQELFAYKNNFGQGKTNLSLDIPNQLAAGAYLFSIKNKQGQLGYYKLIKQ